METETTETTEDIFFEDEYVDQSTEGGDICRYGYATLYSERAPVNDDHINCQSPESALLFYLEKTYLNIPNHLLFNNLKKDIPEEHHARITDVWSKVVKHKRRTDSAARVLRATWENPPKGINYKKAREIKAQTPLEMGKRFGKGALAIISKPRDQKTTQKKQDLQDWHTLDRAIRRELYHDFRNYLTALRAYYEMLLEHDLKEKKYVLPKNHKHREEIAERNRYVRVIHTFHAVAEGAKAAHHEQGKKRIRKGEKVPYVAHSMRSAAAGIYDILPHTFDGKESVEIGLITLTTALLIHDVLEDTELSIDQIIEQVVRKQIDAIDSTLSQILKPAFKRIYLEKTENMHDEDGSPLDEEAKERKVNELFQNKVIKLINDNREKILRQILRILSDNNPLTDKQKKKACQNNIAGGEKTLALCGIKQKELKQWGLKRRISQNPSSKTFKQWPEEYDNGKLARFLMRLTSISDSDANRRLSLWVKIHDRADNIETQQNMDISLQLSNLRATTTRLLSWCINDHDNKKYPLYNSIHRLITVSIKEYERLQKEAPDSIEDGIDSPITKQLKEWEKEIKPLALPTHFQKVIDDFEQAKRMAA